MKITETLFLILVMSLFTSFAFAQTDFINPYGVLVDSKNGYIYVSNVNGDLNAKDDNGFISRLKLDGTVDDARFLDGASPAITLHAPTGMTIIGNYLYVCDIDAIHAFNHLNKKFLFDINFGDLPVGHFYSIIVGPDGAMYVTDGGVGKIYRIDVPRQHEVTLFAEGANLGGPRGIAWYPPRQSFIVTGGVSGQVVALDNKGKIKQTPAIFLKSVQGVDLDDAGNIYVADMEFKSVYKIGSNFALGSFEQGVEGPAGVAYNRSGQSIIVAAFWGNAVKIYPVK